MIAATADDREQDPREDAGHGQGFLNDLFEAKLKYVTTRPYWNEPQAKPKLY